jgi:predicted nucleic acid-binding protein
MVTKLLPTTLVGSYPRPEWLIDRAKLAGRFQPRVRAKELWRMAPRAHGMEAAVLRALLTVGSGPDTNILSAGAPTKSTPTTDLVGWMERNSERLYLSAITVAEVENGITIARREAAHRKADRITEWLETLLHLYTDRILKLDVPTARVLGRLSESGARRRARAGPGRSGDRGDAAAGGWWVAGLQALTPPAVVFQTR